VNIDVKNLNFVNHTVTASLELEIYGIENLTINGISEKPDFIIVQVSDSSDDKVNCTIANDYGNDTYSYKGELNDASWYLYSVSEGFPFDPNFLQFNIIHLDFVIDNATYGSSVFGN
jgi:hypothetical protein